MKELKENQKECENYRGTGRVNNRMETTYWDYGHNSFTAPTSDPCPKCKGRGYLELKWV